MPDAPVLQLVPPDLADQVRLYLDTVAPRVRRVVRRPLAEALHLYRQGPGDAASIHAVGSALFATIGARVPVTYTPNVTPTDGELRLARWLGHRQDLRALALTHHGQRSIEHSGAFSSVSRAHVAAPWSDPRPVDDKLRVGTGDKIVLALGDSTRENDHVLALWAVGILAFADPAWRLLISGRGPKVDRVRKFASGSGLPGIVIFAEDVLPGLSDEALLATCDYAVSTARRISDAGPLLRALASGKPTLAVDSPHALEFVPAHSIVRNPTPRQLAQHLLNLDAALHPAPAAT